MMLNDTHLSSFNRMTEIENKRQLINEFIRTIKEEYLQQILQNLKRFIDFIGEEQKRN